MGSGCAQLGSGCGLVARAIASNTSGRVSNPVIANIYILKYLYLNDENKENEVRNGPFKKHTHRQASVAWWICPCPPTCSSRFKS